VLCCDVLQLELMLAKRIEALHDLKQKVAAFRVRLAAEKRICQKIKRPAPAPHN
jgi:hypothetical protein